MKLVKWEISLNFGASITFVFLIVWMNVVENSFHVRNLSNWNHLKGNSIDAWVNNFTSGQEEITSCYESPRTCHTNIFSPTWNGLDTDNFPFRYNKRHKFVRFFSLLWTEMKLNKSWIRHAQLGWQFMCVLFTQQEMSTFVY